MHRVVPVILLACAPLIVGCAGSRAEQPDPSAARLDAIDKKVGELDSRLEKLEDLLRAALGGAKEPDPSALYAVPVDGDPFEGPVDAKVTVVKAFEFACGYCYRARPTVAQMLETYAGQVKVVYKYFVVHDQAIAPGLAVCAAHRQGKFTAMKDLIWDKGFAAEDIGEDKMKELALELGLDEARYDADVAPSGPCMDWLKQDHGQLVRLGVRGTPAWYVNGRFVSGAQPFGAFKSLIDQELRKADAAIAGGVPVADYYLREILTKGETEVQ